MESLKQIYQELSRQEDLTQEEVKGLFDAILQDQLTESQIAAFLLGLAVKGETADEITGIVQALKAHALVLPEVFTDAMCNCGTGGDQSYSFNISTTVSFVLAAGGIRVAKAGNRSISSKSGSADVLEALGINIAASPETLAKALDQVGLAFIFAQSMHPAMRFIGPARKVLGIPTVMNLVGPLANPLDLETQLMGIYREELQEMAVQVMQKLGRKRAMVITGPDHMDEAALYGQNTYTLLENGQISQGQFSYRDLGMPKVELADIRGGDARENAEILLSVLKNEASPYLETTVLNAGLGFYANGKVATIQKGIALARQLLADGSALVKLRQLQEVQV
ncbi:anthranilate phosphoribosyltransferase [Streptococcus dentasini]